MRFAAPPADGRVQMLPCMSMASVRPSGETATDMDVPSEGVTSIGGCAGAASRAAKEIVASNAPPRIMCALLPILPALPIQPFLAHSTDVRIRRLMKNPFDF